MVDLVDNSVTIKPSKYVLFSMKYLGKTEKIEILLASECTCTDKKHQRKQCFIFNHLLPYEHRILNRI